MSTIREKENKKLNLGFFNDFDKNMYWLKRIVFRILIFLQHMFKNV